MVFSQNFTSEMLSVSKSGRYLSNELEWVNDETWFLAGYHHCCKFNCIFNSNGQYLRLKRERFIWSDTPIGYVLPSDVSIQIKFPNEEQIEKISEIGLGLYEFFWRHEKFDLFLKFVERSYPSNYWTDIVFFNAEKLKMLYRHGYTLIPTLQLLNEADFLINSMDDYDALLNDSDMLTDSICFGHYDKVDFLLNVVNYPCNTFKFLSLFNNGDMLESVLIKHERSGSNFNQISKYYKTLGLLINHHNRHHPGEIIMDSRGWERMVAGPNSLEFYLPHTNTPFRSNEVYPFEIPDIFLAEVLVHFKPEFTDIFVSLYGRSPKGPNCEYLDPEVF